ncbi:MAG: hypothetical protein WBD13_20490 [Burkholderiaceae bacterium]
MVLPAALFKALVPRLASAVSLRVVGAAFNHLLAQHPNARRRLAAHQTKTICIGLENNLPRVVDAIVSPPTLWYKIEPDGSLRTAPAGNADATLLVQPSIQAAMDVASSGTGDLARHLRVEGDVLLAGLVGELVQDLRWDYEDDLSRVVGDIPARRVGEFAQRVGGFGQQLSREFGRRVTAAATGVHDAVGKAQDSAGTGRSSARAPDDTDDSLKGGSKGGSQSTTQDTSADSSRNTDDPTAPLLARSVFDHWRNDVQALNRRLDTIEEKLRSK